MPLGDFALSQLKLDQKNVRTGDQDSQRAALHALISEREPYKIANLGRDIIARGRLSPGEPIWVTVDPDDATSFIVLEGNRRVGALKMLENPALATGTAVATDFTELAKEFAKKPIRKLTAEVFANREEAQEWIDLRHMGATSGAGLQPWRSLAKERARVGSGKPMRRSLAVLDYLDDGSEEFEAVGYAINAKATTVDRVLNSPAMTEVLGVHIDKKHGSISFDNGDEKAGRQLLRDVITTMADPSFKFSRIRDTKDRATFLKEFSDRAVGKPGGTGSSATTGAAAGKSGRKRLTDPVRKTLAPKSGRDIIAKVPGKRLNQLYRECREIVLAGNENAAAFLLRVFIELSSEALLIEKSTPLPAKFDGKKTNWSEIGISLHDKINAAMTVLDTNATTKKQLKGARVALADPHSSGSIDTLHSYFHNLEHTPEVATVRAGWDVWQNYLRLLHAARI